MRTKDINWKTSSFNQRCKFISKLIRAGFSKGALSGFMKRKFGVREREWIKCVNALDENCNYIERR